MALYLSEWVEHEKAHARNIGIPERWVTDYAELVIWAKNYGSFLPTEITKQRVIERFTAAIEEIAKLEKGTK